MASGRGHIDKQTSFAGGRFSPELHGRTDLAKYTSAFRDSKNFFVSPEGTLINRAGTEMVGEVENNNIYDGPVPSRLVPFVFSDDDVVIMAFGGDPTTANGPGFVRFYKYDRDTDAITLLDATVERWSLVDADAYIYDWAATTSFPWTQPQAADFRFVQSGDTLYVSYETTVSGVGSINGQPFKLIRQNTESTLWRYELLDVTPKPFPSYGGTPRIKEQLDDSLTSPDDTSLPEADDEHPARVWQWAVSRVMQTADGAVYESLPFVVTDSASYQVEAWRADVTYGGAGGYYDYVFIENPEKFFSGDNLDTVRENWFYTGGTAKPPGVLPSPVNGVWAVVDGTTVDPINHTSPLPEKLVCYADRPQYIDWRVYTQQPETIDADADTIIATRIYKGRDGHFGYIGQVAADVYRFIDDGLVPDFATPPRSTDNYLQIKGGRPLGHPDYTAPIKEWPTALGMYEGRFIMAATQLRPGLVIGSAVDRFNVIDSQQVSKDADPYAFELASRKWEKIRFIVGRHGMYLFTSEGEWVAAGSGQYEVLTPNSLAIRQVSEFGSAKLQPLIVGESVIFIENTGCEPRAFFMQGMQSKSADMASYSRYFFRGRQVVSWCWSEVPWQTLWLAMDDGKLLSCCWNPDQQMAAWAEHEIQGGTVESVVAIPADREHAVVLLVKRGSKYYMERMQTRILTDVLDSRFLDAHVFYDGRNTSTNTAVVTSIAAARAIGDTVDVDFTSGTEDDTGQWLNYVVRVRGTKTTTAGTDEYGDDITTTESVHAEVLLLSSTGADEYQGELLTNLEEDMDGVSTTSWEICREDIYGLDHLEGQYVAVLADGAVIEKRKVEGGSVMLSKVPGSTSSPMTGRRGQWASVICVGLTYDCDFESLAMVPEKSRQRVVRSVLVETFGSRGGYVGQDLDDEDNLEEVVTREVQHEYGTIPLKVEEIPTNIRASYDIKGTIGFRQSAPLPISIISIVREVEFGDR